MIKKQFLLFLSLLVFLWFPSFGFAQTTPTVTSVTIVPFGSIGIGNQTVTQTPNQPPQRQVQIVLTGSGFGSNKGTITVSVNGKDYTITPEQISRWSDTHIVLTTTIPPAVQHSVAVCTNEQSCTTAVVTNNTIQVVYTAESERKGELLPDVHCAAANYTRFGENLKETALCEGYIKDMCVNEQTKNCKENTINSDHYCAKEKSFTDPKPLKPKWDRELNPYYYTKCYALKTTTTSPTPDPNAEITVTLRITDHFDSVPTPLDPYWKDESPNCPVSPSESSRKNKHCVTIAASSHTKPGQNIAEEYWSNEGAAKLVCVMFISNKDTATNPRRIVKCTERTQQGTPQPGGTSSVSPTKAAGGSCPAGCYCNAKGQVLCDFTGGGVSFPGDGVPLDANGCPQGWAFCNSVCHQVVSECGGNTAPPPSSSGGGSSGGGNSGGGSGGAPTACRSDSCCKARYGGNSIYQGGTCQSGCTSNDTCARNLGGNATCVSGRCQEGSGAPPPGGECSLNPSVCESRGANYVCSSDGTCKPGRPASTPTVSVGSNGCSTTDPYCPPTPTRAQRGPCDPDSGYCPPTPTSRPASGGPGPHGCQQPGGCNF